MGLNTAASISFSQINSTSYFTNGNLGINTTNPTANLDVAGTINASGLSSLASITTGALSATNVVGNSISAGTLSATTITGANLSLSGNLSVAGTLTTVNITSTNMLNTNISAGTINATGLSSLQNVTATNVSSGTLRATGLSALANVTVTGAGSGVGSNGSLLISGNDNFGHALYVASSANNKRLAFNHNGTIGWMFSYDYGSNVPQNLSLQGPGGNLGVGVDTPIYKLDVGGTLRATTTNNTIYTPTCAFANDSTVGGTAVASFLVPNMANGSLSFPVYVGKSLSVGNSSSLTYSYVGPNNSANYIALGHYGLGGGLYLLNNGNVGVGTNSPSYNLDVSGTLRATGTSVLANVTATNVSTGTLTASGLSALANVTATNVSAGVVIASTGITTGTISVSGLSALANATATNVSAGTLTASTGITTGTISVSGTSVLANATATNISAGTLNASTGITAASAQITNENVTTSTIATLRVSSNLLALGNSNTLGNIYTTGGNVGVGTVSPGESLDVRGNLRIGNSSQSNYISFYGTTGDEPGAWSHTYIGERLYGGSEGSELLLFKGNDTTTVAGPDRIRYLSANHLFDTYTSPLSGTFAGVGTSGTTRMIIDLNGNVGINTTSPTANLDVTGTARFTTSVTSGLLSATNIVGNSISAGTLSGTTITGANLSLSGNLIVGGTLTTVNITSTNMLNTNISAGTINATSLSSLQNVTLTNVSAGVVIASTGVTTGTISVSGLSSLQNVTATNISAGVVIASTGITTGTISVSGLSALANATATNISAGVVIASTGVTTGTISVSGLSALANVSAGTLRATGLSALANVTVTGAGSGVGSNGSLLISGNDNFGHSLYVQAANGKRLVFSNNGSVGNIFSYDYGSNVPQNLSLQGPGGNLGVGTASPAYTLDVSGTARVSSNLFVTGNIGIGTTSPSGMLHLNNAALFTSAGNLTCTGDVVSFGSLSDRRLKKNIETIETAKALDIVSKLRAVSFDWKDDIFNEEKRNTSDLGFIAQEVEELIPEAVSEYTQIESGEVYKNIKHERLVPYLLSAIQYLLSKQA